MMYHLLNMLFQLYGSADLVGSVASRAFSYALLQVVQQQKSSTPLCGKCTKSDYRGARQ